MEVDTAIYRSPKRKRGQATLNPTLVTSGLSQYMSTPSDHADDVGSHSPSMKMTGKFQKMDLQSPIDFGTSVTECRAFDSQPQPHVASDDTTATASTATSPTPGYDTLTPEFKPPTSSEFTFESPLQRASTPQPATPEANMPIPSSKRSKSPPPSAVMSDQFWHASEITGWSPDDPDEDNYGINGVGYAKTASKAWSLSQKRKQQIAEYRSRETREARQRRHERRLSGRNSRRGSPRPGNSSSESGQENRSGSRDRKGVRFVHFDDG